MTMFMPKPLLSTYRTGENRVTSSTMAVFERIDLALVEELLRAVTGMGSELQAVTFENQVVLGDATPDAQISARFSWWFETKTVTGAYAHEGAAVTSSAITARSSTTRTRCCSSSPGTRNSRPGSPNPTGSPMRSSASGSCG